MGTPRIGEVLPFTVNGRISLSWEFGVPNPRIGEVLPFTMHSRISLSWGFGVPNPPDRRSPPVHDERQDKFILGVRGSEPPGSGVHDEREGRGVHGHNEREWFTTEGSNLKSHKIEPLFF